jgi:hypothetical protein
VATLRRCSPQVCMYVCMYVDGAHAELAEQQTINWLEGPPAGPHTVKDNRTRCYRQIENTW